jgi:serine protease Do
MKEREFIMNDNENRYSFHIESLEQQEEQRIAEPRHTESQIVDRRYVKRMITKAIAITLALALVLGGGIGAVLNEFVFNPDDAPVAAAPESESPTPSDTPTVPNNTSNSAGNLLYTENTNTSSMSIPDVVANVEDSVVAITVEIENTATYMYQNYSYTSQAKGSGVIISADGYIITNNHVVAGASKVSVTLANGETYDAELIGSDDFTDLGLIKIDAKNLTVAQFGDSEGIRKGETAIIIGNPLGYLDGSVSVGVISAMGRTLTFDDGSTLTNLIQTDAAVNPGNSGGGMFDSRGALIGVVCAKSSSVEVEGLGFVIPVSTVRKVAQDIKDYGYVKGRPALGVNIQVVDNVYTAMANGLPRTGIYVTGFINSEAQAASELKIGDCIVGVNGVEVTTQRDILGAVFALNVGDKVEIQVLRSSELLTVSTTLIEQDASY